MRAKRKFLWIGALWAMGMPTAEAVECDGTELLCLNLDTKAEVEAAGGKIVGGQFTTTGFTPSPGGGIDFDWGPEVDLSSGTLEFDIEGLLPVDAEELAGGKVSLFSFCGVGDQDHKYVGFQKMPPDYHQGHIFRYGMDDDGLEDNWDAVIITSQGHQCPYSIADPPWGPNETHHIVASWGPEGLSLLIDGNNPCNNPATGNGNGDTFDPAEKFLVIGNRCEHYNTQAALARFRNVRLWDSGTTPDPVEPESAEPEPEPILEEDPIYLEAPWTASKVNGNLGDWIEGPTFSLAPEDYVTATNGANIEGAEDLSADVWVGWRGESLRIAFAVTDENHTPYPVAGKLWKGDSIQVGIDVAYTQSVDGYDIDDWEIGVAFSGGQALTDCYFFPAGVPDSCPIEASATREGNTTFYEVDIPKVVGGGVVGFSVLVNDRDSGVREGWLELTPGMGVKKSPALFATLAFTGDPDEETEEPDGAGENGGQVDGSESGESIEGEDGGDPTAPGGEGDEAPDPGLDGEGTPRGEDPRGDNPAEGNGSNEPTGSPGFAGGAYDTTSSDTADSGGCSSSASMFANPALWAGLLALILLPTRRRKEDPFED